MLRSHAAALVLRSAWSRKCGLLECLLQERLLLISVFRLDCFTLLATLFDQLVFGQLWGRLRFEVVRIFFGIGTGMTWLALILFDPVNAVSQVQQQHGRSCISG